METELWTMLGAEALRSRLVKMGSMKTGFSTIQDTFKSTRCNWDLAEQSMSAPRAGSKSKSQKCSSENPWNSNFSQLETSKRKSCLNFSRIVSKSKNTQRDLQAHIMLLTDQDIELLKGNLLLKWNSFEKKSQKKPGNSLISVTASVKNFVLLGIWTRALKSGMSWH